MVSSGFGTRAHWFRNVRANPQVRVYLRSRPPAPATAHLMAPDQAAPALAAYAARHPRAWATLKPVLETTLGTTISEHQTGLPLVHLTLGGRSGGAPVPRPAGPAGNAGVPGSAAGQTLPTGRGAHG